MMRLIRTLLLISMAGCSASQSSGNIIDQQNQETNEVSGEDSLQAEARSETCTRIVMEQSVEATNSSELSKLEGYTHIERDLVIVGQDNSERPLTTLSPLKCLQNIGGTLRIEFNEELTDIKDLSSLSSVSSHVQIVGNNKLMDLRGLDSLTSVNGDLWIEGNRTLESLKGLHSIVSVKGRISVWTNNNLTNLEGLHSLTSGSDWLFVSRNEKLINLEGLNSLTKIDGDLIIEDNASLTSLDGLNIISVGGSVMIADNASLTRLGGLGKISSVGGDIEFVGNSSLPTCEAEAFRDTLRSNGWTGKAQIENTNDSLPCSSI